MKGVKVMHIGFKGDFESEIQVCIHSKWWLKPNNDWIEFRCRWIYNFFIWEDGMWNCVCTKRKMYVSAFLFFDHQQDGVNWPSMWTNGVQEKGVFVKFLNDNNFGELVMAMWIQFKLNVNWRNWVNKEWGCNHNKRN